MGLIDKEHFRGVVKSEMDTGALSARATQKLMDLIDSEDEIVAHCNVKENAELIARIMDADVDGRAYGRVEINRAALQDAIERLDWYHINKNGELVHGANSKEDVPLYKAEDVQRLIEEICDGKH